MPINFPFIDAQSNYTRIYFDWNDVVTIDAFRYDLGGAQGAVQNARDVAAQWGAQAYAALYSNGIIYTVQLDTWGLEFDLSPFTGTVQRVSGPHFSNFPSFAALFDLFGWSHIDYAAIAAQQAATAATIAAAQLEAARKAQLENDRANAIQAALIVEQQAMQQAAQGRAWADAYGTQAATLKTLAPGNTEASQYLAAKSEALAAHTMLDWIDSHPIDARALPEYLTSVGATVYTVADFRAANQSGFDAAVRRVGDYAGRLLDSTPSRTQDARHPLAFGDWFVNPDSREGYYVRTLAPQIVAVFDNGQWDSGTLSVFSALGNPYAARLAQKYDAQWRAITTAIERIRTGQSLDKRGVQLALAHWDKFKPFGPYDLTQSAQRYLMLNQETDADLNRLTTGELAALMARIPTLVSENSAGMQRETSPQAALMRAILSSVAPTARTPACALQVKYYPQGGEYFVLYPFSPRNEYVSKVLAKSQHFADYFMYIGVALAAFGVSNALQFFVKQATGVIGKVANIKMPPGVAGALSGGLDAIASIAANAEWFEAFTNDLIPFDDLGDAVDYVSGADVIELDVQPDVTPAPEPAPWVQPDVTPTPEPAPWVQPDVTPTPEPAPWAQPDVTPTPEPAPWARPDVTPASAESHAIDNPPETVLNPNASTLSISENPAPVEYVTPSDDAIEYPYPPEAALPDVLDVTLQDGATIVLDTREVVQVDTGAVVAIDSENTYTEYATGVSPLDDYLNFDESVSYDFAGDAAPGEVAIDTSGDAYIVPLDGGTPETVALDDRGQVVSFTDDDGNIFYSDENTTWTITADELETDYVAAMNEAGAFLLSNQRTGETASIPAVSSVMDAARALQQTGSPAGTSASGNPTPARTYPDTLIGLAAAVVDAYARIKTTAPATLRPYTQPATSGGFKTVNGKTVRVGADGKPIAVPGAGGLSGSTGLILGVAAVAALVLFSRKGV